MGAHISAHLIRFVHSPHTTSQHFLAHFGLCPSPSYLLFFSFRCLSFSLFQLWIVMVMMPNSQCTLNIYWNAKQIQLIKHTMPITLILNYVFFFHILCFHFAMGEREKLNMKLLCAVAICNLWVWVENVWCAHICAVINTDYWYRYFTLIIL